MDVYRRRREAIEWFVEHESSQELERTRLPQWDEWWSNPDNRAEYEEVIRLRQQMSAFAPPLVLSEDYKIRLDGGTDELKRGVAMKRTGTLITLYLVASLGQALANDAAATELSRPTGSGDETAYQEGKKSSPFRLAQAGQGQAAGFSAVGGNSSQSSSQQAVDLEEIVVTAQKRTERLQDVPLSMSVLDSQSLVEANQVKISDYYASVPGLSIAAGAQSSNVIAIRGIAPNSAVSQALATTGIVIDDSPIGGGNTVMPDLDPSDLQRIEVLRGPQGTLYGASSMGGLIRFVTLDPSTAALTGNVSAGMSGMQNEAGYVFRGSANVPFTSNLAVRASGFIRQDPGYLDNPILGLKGANEAHASGGHLSLLWHPTERFTLKLSALYQRYNQSSTSDETTVELVTGQQMPLGDLQQGYTRNGQYSDQTTQAYSAVLSYLIGGFELKSITGVNIIEAKDSNDLSLALGGLSEQTFGVTGWTNPEDFGRRTVTEELRGSSTFGSLDIQTGLYFSDTVLFPDGGLSYAFSTNAYTGAQVFQWAQFIGLSSNGADSDESAVFANLTYHFTSRFKLQAGARQSRDRQFATTDTIIGQFDPVLLKQPSPYTTQAPGATQYPFTYLISPQYNFTPDLMVYGRVATGFRPGGPNSGEAIAQGAPTSFQPDTTKNYEFGSKGNLLNGLLSYDASLYYIVWDNMQVALSPSNRTYVYDGNAGAAKSEGAELTVELRPTSGLRLSAWMAFDDAEITKMSPNVTSFYAVPGDRLPYAARLSGSFSAEQIFPISNDLRTFVGGTVTYLGDRESLFTTTPERTRLPPYAKVDLKAGLYYGPWTVNVFVNNITDKRGIISGGLGSVNPTSFFTITPRTVGFTLARAIQ